MLHCEVLQLPLFIGWGCGWCQWCGMPGIGVCGWKMAKDTGMTIRKSIVVSFLPCLVAFLAFHPYMFFHFFYDFSVTCFCLFFLGGGGGENHGSL